MTKSHQIIDFAGKVWTRDGVLVSCEDGVNSIYVLEYDSDEQVAARIKQTFGPAVPQIVEMAYARKALHRAGVLANVSALINQMAEPARTEAAIDWEFQPTVRRDSTLVQTLGPALGLTSAQVDELFILAFKLQTGELS